jgi:hypothetical protein
MTTGALIFAFNNEHIDYVAMAKWSAKNIERHLGIPTRIITDEDVAPSGEYKRTFNDLPESVTWYNGNRTDAYRLSPWDRTLVLDADYVVASNQLMCLLELDQDFTAHKTAYDVTGQANFDELNNFGRHQMPMWWATVMMFRKSRQAELIFECMQMVKDNWMHYKNLYGVYRPTYRNDHALSIALGIVNGHTLNHADIPWTLASVTHDHKLTQISKDEYKVEYLTANKRPRWIKLTHDFHAMGKGHLGAIVANPC